MRTTLSGSAGQRGPIGGHMMSVGPYPHDTEILKHEKFVLPKNGGRKRRTLKIGNDIYGPVTVLQGPVVRFQFAQSFEPHEMRRI